MTLRIEQKSLAEIQEHGVKTFPDECCGFMFGKEEGVVRSVSNILQVNNIKHGDKRNRFAISPLDYMKAEQYADANELHLLGIYHSHPNHPSVPSEHDRIAAQPYFSYVIISVVEREYKSVQSWRLNEAAQFEEETIF